MQYIEAVESYFVAENMKINFFSQTNASNVSLDLNPHSQYPNIYPKTNKYQILTGHQGNLALSRGITSTSSGL